MTTRPSRVTAASRAGSGGSVGPSGRADRPARRGGSGVPDGATARDASRGSAVTRRRGTDSGSDTPGEEDREPAQRLDGRRVATQRMRQRRRRSLVLLLLVMAAGLVLVDLARDQTRRPAGPVVDRAPAPADSAVAPPTSDPVLRPEVPTRAPTTAPVGPPAGPGTFAYASSAGPLLGTAGPLRRFRVAVEERTGQEPAAFAADVDRILGDPRSWVASKRLRLQRVPTVAGAEFTIFLATPATSERMCAAGGLATDRYTSCRVPGQVIINLARWLTGVPHFRAPLAEYRAYAINHEVGHQLGYGHEACPRPGAPAPVMQQQTLALDGCVAYGYPYLNGRRYAGRQVP